MTARFTPEALVAFSLYVVSIVSANWLTDEFGLAGNGSIWAG